MVPAEVDACARARGDPVDFFGRVLADVAEPQVASVAVEAEAPWVSQADREDFGACARGGGVGVIGRDGVRQGRGRCVDVDPQEIARTVAFLIEEGTFCCGEVVSVNAGAVI